MISSSETITLLLGISVLIFLFENRSRLAHLPAHRILVSGFLFLQVGWLATVLEGFLLGDYLNLLEHVCYTVSSVLILIWCRQVFIKRKARC